MLIKLIVVLQCLSASAHAHQKLSVQSMHELEPIATEGDARQTLFVFDIDNTLLRTKSDLGGDAWFSWQEELLKNSPQHPDLVARDFAGLLTVQGWLFALGQMLPPEADTPFLVRAFQEAGHPLILLTSRGLSFENVTNRELQRNGYDSQKTAIAPRAGFAAAFLPYDLRHPEEACLTEADVQKLGLREAQPVVYRAGIMLTSGQHKGAMLRSLLCKLKAQYERIIFVDDQQRHVDRVFAAYEDQPGDVRSIRYAQMDAEVENFRMGDKSGVREQWRRLKAVIDEIF